MPSHTDKPQTGLDVIMKQHAALRRDVEAMKAHQLKTTPHIASVNAAHPSIAGADGQLMYNDGRRIRPILYGAKGQNEDTGQTTSDLFIVDPTDASVSSIGPIGFAVVGMAYDSLNKVMYGATSSNSASNPNHLITIDLETGAGTVPDFSDFQRFDTGDPVHVTDLTFDNLTATMYAHSFPERLLGIIKTDATIVGYFYKNNINPTRQDFGIWGGASGFSSGGCAYNWRNNAILILNNQDAFAALNFPGWDTIGTGAPDDSTYTGISSTGDLNSLMRVNGCDIMDNEDIAYAVRSTVDGSPFSCSLTRINYLTGTWQDQGTLPNGFSALAFGE